MRTAATKAGMLHRWYCFHVRYWKPRVHEFVTQMQSSLFAAYEMRQDAVPRVVGTRSAPRIDSKWRVHLDVVFLVDPVLGPDLVLSRKRGESAWPKCQNICLHHRMESRS